MTKGLSISATMRFIIALAATGLAVVALQNWAALINALVLAIIITLLASPLLFGLRNRGIPSSLAFILTLLLILAIILAFAAMVIISANRLIQSLPEYAAELSAQQSVLAERLSSLGLDMENLTILFNALEPNRIIPVILDALLGLMNAVSNIVLVMLIVAFLLAEAYSFPQKIAEQIRLGHTWCARLTRFNHDVRHYVSITAAVGVLAATLDVGLLLVLGVDFALFWGILSFIFSFIPTIGFWLALIPPFILALLESGWTTALIVFIGYVLINGLADTVIKPKYMGSGLNLSTAVVFLSLVFWGIVLGPLGAILAAPMTMAFKQLVLEADPDNVWIAELMSADALPHNEAPARGGDDLGNSAAPVE